MQNAIVSLVKSISNHSKIDGPKVLAYISPICSKLEHPGFYRGRHALHLRLKQVFAAGNVQPRPYSKIMGCAEFWRQFKGAY